MTLTIPALPRAEGTKAKALRRDGRIPANLYGHDGGNSTLLTISAKDLMFLLREVKNGQTDVELAIEGDKSHTAVLQEVQKHPWKNGIIYHVSFYAAKS